MELSNRQKLIFEAVKKMQEGERIYNEGLLEFNQLTGEDGKKLGSGGQEVTSHVKKMESSKKKGKSNKKKGWNPRITQEYLDYLLNVIQNNKTEAYPTAHWLAKKPKTGGWTKVNAAVEILAKSGRINIINRPRYADSAVVAKCIVLP